MGHKPKSKWFGHTYKKLKIKMRIKLNDIN